MEGIYEKGHQWRDWSMAESKFPIYWDCHSSKSMFVES